MTNSALWAIGTVFAILLPALFLIGRLLTGIKRREQDNERLAVQMRELALAAKVFEHSRQSIVITNAGGVILRVNNYFTMLTGFTEAEAVGKTPRIIKSQHHDASFYAELWKALVEEGHWKGEIWNRKKNGDGYAAMLTISSVRDETGEILFFIGINDDITEQKIWSDRIFHLAHFDILTNLPNRQLFNDRFQFALKQAERYQRRLAIFFLDIDNFKMVNDTLGHYAGDILLQRVSERVSDCLRKIDTVARLGGVEFAIILEDVRDTESVERVARKIINSVSKPFFLDGSQAHVGVSIGISIYPDDGDDITILFKNADAAMYRAKTAGRNRWQFFGDEMG
jgi:diguanylate cyclase (GGDEF)-like protein/PAS domain S-box-containing protein